MSRRKRRNSTGIVALLTALMVLMVAATGYLIWLCIDMTGQPADQTPGLHQNVTLPPQGGEETVETEPTQAPTETEPTGPQPEHVVATATLGAMGDLVMHMPVVDTCVKDGGYDFESVFRYIRDDITALDCAAINLETTLAGLDNGYKYSGFPKFNCPDEIVDGVKEAGFDIMLTANNHSYDTDLVGLKRTVETVREKGMTALGTMSSADDPKYIIQDINGIKVGMICYTYAFKNSADGRPSLNGNPRVSEPGLVNWFKYEDLPGFYEELGGYLDQMKAEGAEATVLYIHWGVEYQTYAKKQQKEIAQELANLGIDVVIGGHPHVVEPMALVESKVDPSHKTVVIYSVGNAISNQRIGESDMFATGHTEDGLLFTVTFEKYSDGKVYLADTDAIPLWVNKSTVNGPLEFNILPLREEEMDSWAEKYKLTDMLMLFAQKSLARTQEIVNEGLETCRQWLAQSKADRETYYQDLFDHPEKYAAQATEPTEQTVPETTENAA